MLSFAALGDEYLHAPELVDWQLVLERILRYKPYTLGKREEQLLAMQAEMSQAANRSSSPATWSRCRWTAKRPMPRG